MNTIKITIATLLALFGCHNPEKPKSGIGIQITYQECIVILAAQANISKDIYDYYGTPKVTYEMAEAYVDHLIVNCIRGK